MTFCWDENKRRANLDKHGLDFSDARIMFDFAMVEDLDERQDYGEERWVGLGLLHDIVAAIVFVEVGDAIRIISLRRARSGEVKRYEREIRNRLGPG